MLFLIRHGERADDSTNAEKQRIILSFDPHLSINGESQAKKTGKYIRNILKLQSIENIILVTSPYLRCVQTIIGIASQLEQQIQIYIAKGLGECFRQDWFEKDVLSELHYYKSSQFYDHVFKQYPLLDVPYQEVIQQYPESIQEFFGRFSENYKRMREYFQNKHILVVTHGYGVHAVNMLEKQVISNNADYCSVNVISYQKDNVDYLLLNSTAHLKKSKL
ncbi:unnamed protein product [Paramecium primaurelia]|uniref:Phosphoglycerate mutase n=2 Tax=Paramecium TaxID=5884 RepID=A0A8S1VW82_9CILI|nr:unnamed protein product [Paramecium primaurelia]CAD8180039.1 unnamed protein product [Paramecium pentaurelia]